MSLGFMIYLITLLDSFNQTLNIVFWVLFIVMGCWAIALSASGNWYDAKLAPCFKKYFFKSLKIMVSCMILITLIPSESTMAAMYLVPRIVENKDIQQVPANAAKLLNLGLEKFVGDLEKKAVGDGK